TPVGMRGTGKQKAGAQTLLEPNEINARLVFDLVYNPIDTPLIKAAREKGIPVITGVEMFVHQGARQFEIWTGKPAPEEEMLRVVLHALRQQAEADAAEAAESKPEVKARPSAKPVAKPAAKPKSEQKPKPSTKLPAKPAAKKAAKPKPPAKPAAKKAAKPKPAAK